MGVCVRACPAALAAESEELMSKLSREQQERESREMRWERYVLWYRPIPKRSRRHNSDWSRKKKTFYERSQVDDFLADHPDYEACRIDKIVQEIEWRSWNE